jgi:hypothetical protein
MKVLEKGSWDNPWSKEAVCSEKECGAKILIEEGDVKPIDYGEDYYAECGICGSHVKISWKDIPLRMRKVLNVKRKYASWD